MNYKTDCPQCHGHNFYVTEDNGMGYCFNCEYTERSNQQKIETRSPNVAIFREIYKELARYYHSCLSTEQRDYLHQRGINDTTIERRLIGFCPSTSHTLYLHPLAYDAGVIKKNREPFLADRIIFPYQLEDQIIDLRGRIIHGDGEKYLSLRNSAFYRGADFAYAADTQGDLEIITEGEIKTLIAEQEGYTIHGLPGMLSKRRTSLYPSKDQIICLDSQKRHRPQLLKAIMNLAKRLAHPLIATLPLRGKDKQDIDGYILAYGKNAFDTVVRSAVPYQLWLKYI